MRRFFAVPGLPVLAMLASAAGKQPITGADVLKIRNVASVAVASDGSFAVYGVQSIYTDVPADSKTEPAYKYRTHLWRIDLNNPQAKPEQLTFGDRSDSSPAISPDNRTLALVRVDADGPHPRPQVWLLPLRGPGEAQAVTKLEDGAAAPVWRPDGKALLVTTEIPISRLEGKPHFDLESPGRDWFDWDRAAPGATPAPDARPDGDRRALRNWLAHNASKDNPTVIDRINFLGANPRGSGGYGYEFQKANFRNWGKGPMEDVLAALDDTQKAGSPIDRNRLFLTGGSYAGYLTAWVIGHDQRFKAASAQRGVYDLSTFYGEATAWPLVPEEFGGYPWEPETRKVLDEESPITYVTSIRTPFLIIHGSQDFRTGFAQSEMLFRSLKQLNRPVEYVRYPAIGHELTRSGPPLQRMDHMLRIIEFFERYAKNERPAPVERKDAPAKSAETADAHQ